MPADGWKQPQGSKYPQQLTKQVPEQDVEDIQNNIKLKEHLQKNYQIQGTEGKEIYQVITDLESYFQQPVGQECDTEWNQAEEHTMEHIFVLQDIDTPPTHSITQSGHLMPADGWKQPQGSKYPQQLTKQVPEQDEEDIQNNIKYNNI